MDTIRSLKQIKEIEFDRPRKKEFDPDSKLGQAALGWIQTGTPFERGVDYLVNTQGLSEEDAAETYQQALDFYYSHLNEGVMTQVKGAIGRVGQAVSGGKIGNQWAAAAQGENDAKAETAQQRTADAYNQAYKKAGGTGQGKPPTQQQTQQQPAQNQQQQQQPAQSQQAQQEQPAQQQQAQQADTSTQAGSLANQNQQQQGQTQTQQTDNSQQQQTTEQPQQQQDITQTPQFKKASGAVQNNVKQLNQLMGSLKDSAPYWQSEIMLRLNEAEYQNNAKSVKARLGNIIGLAKKGDQLSMMMAFNNLSQLFINYAKANPIQPKDSKEGQKLLTTYQK